MMRCARGVVLAALAGCTGTQALHPPPPPTGQVAPIPDPPPSRVVLHATILPEALQRQLDLHVPREGYGQVSLVAGQALNYRWTREPAAVKFDRNRIVVTTAATGFVSFLGERSVPLSVTVAGEPVVSADYAAQLQSAEVQVKARASLDMINRPLEERLRATLGAMIDGFRLDVRPLLARAYEQLARPLELDVAGRKACAELLVTALEAGPTVLAGGLEKDFGIVILPSVTLPCAPTSAQPRPMPLLANVALVPPGPFRVVVPIAADYVELSKALEGAMGGQLHFSRDYPELYLEKPEVYPSGDTVVIKLVLGGQVKLGFTTLALQGELFFSGHPAVVDNQIVVQDLELTPGTASGLLKLKVLLDGKSIRDQAAAALRVDLSERVRAARDKLSKELSFDDSAGCVRGEVLRTEVKGIYPHASFLRIYVEVDAQAGLFMPCRR